MPRKRIDVMVGAAVKNHEDVDKMYARIKHWANEQGFHLFKVFQMMFTEFIKNHIDGGQDDGGNSTKV